MTRLLLLMPTHTYRAEPFLSAAQRLGVDVTVGTELEQPLARLVPGATVALDFARPEVARQQVVEFARAFPLAAVVGVDDETTVLAALAAAALGLPHNSVESVMAARYKDVMRLALAETPLRTPRFELVGVDQDPETIACHAVYPCVIKPLSLSASRGVIRADTPEALVAAFHEVVAIVGDANLAPDDPAARLLLIEEFIPGREFALEALLRDGVLSPLALFDKPDPLDGPYFEETIYVTPSRLPPSDQQAIVECAAAAAQALGLRDGPVHAEVRLNERGAYLVEIAARSLGGLCSRTLRFGAGVSLEDIVLRHAAGLPMPSLERESRPAGVMMIPIPRGGILREVQGEREAAAVPGVDGVTISIPCGQRLVPLPRGDRYLGFIFAHGSTPAAVEDALREAHRRLRFTIDDV